VSIVQIPLGPGKSRPHTPEGLVAARLRAIAGQYLDLADELEQQHDRPADTPAADADATPDSRVPAAGAA
jgi:hypothetical protein